jgi:hypothetical protein
MRLWEDGFDHYGTDPDNLLDGSYAASGSAISILPSTAQAATGTHSFFFGGTAFNDFGAGTLRKVLTSSVTGLGKTCRVYMPALPTSTVCFPVIMATPTAATNRYHIAVGVDTNGAFKVYRGMFLGGSSSSPGTLLYTSDPLLVAGAWNHIEIQIGYSDTAGFIRIAVNGVHRVEQTGLDTLYNTDPVLSDSTFIYSSSSATSGTFYFDDYILYDFTGDSAVDTDFCPQMDGSKPTNYIGELQVWPLFPNGDTAEADWAKSTGTSGYALIDEPSPDDADYISSSAAADLSEFDLEDLPEEITYIRGLGIHQRLSKSDSGAAFTKAGMKSVAATTDADERPITVAPTYWRDTVDVDPNSSARWTRDSLNAAWLRMTRSV